MKMSRKLAYVAAFLLACPLFISATYISCAPAKSLSKSLKGSTGFASQTPKNICDPIYSPSVASHSKATLSKPVFIESPFKNNKVQMEEFKFSSKASDPQLQNQDISILVNTACAANTPGALTQKVLEQNDLFLHKHPKRAMNYHVYESLTLSQLKTMANADSCIIGVTPPGEISTASLDLPALNDVQLSKQEQYKVMNYAHAYEYLSKISTTVVKIGFADTGVDCTHQDLSANLESGCGYNVITPGTEPTDNDGHGSHTAGTAAGVANNGVGIAGIAGKNAKVYAIKVIDINSGSELSLTTGIQQAISHGVDVLNISIESQTRLTTVEAAVVDAVNAGIVVVMAAGNHSKELGVNVDVSPALQGSTNGAITVGSIDVSGALSSFSNYGNNVEIATVGAIDSSKTGQIGGVYSLARIGLYQRLSGTSQAAPVVAGAAALLIQFFKDHSVTYTPAIIEQIIKASTDNTGINISGGRVLNFSKLVRNAYTYANVPLCP